MLQLISVLGALAILGAYAASQFGLVDAPKPPLPGGELPGLRGTDRSSGHRLAAAFILLEGAWALMSLWGIATILRAGGASPGAH